MVTLDQVDKLKVNELKAACKEMGLEQSGNKADLVARLKEALSQTAGESAPATAGEAGAAATAPADDAVDTEKPAAATATADTTAPAAVPEEPAAGDAPAGEKQRQRIQFNDAEAIKFEASKVQVVNAPAAEKPKTVTESEKLRQRAERFKDEDVEKKKTRAQRFGLIDPALERDKQLKRAERFGTEHPELEKRKKEERAARFGIVDEETKKKQRQDKFKPLTSKPDFNIAVKGDDDFEAKREARAARFAPAT